MSLAACRRPWALWAANTSGRWSLSLLLARKPLESIPLWKSGVHSPLAGTTVAGRRPAPRFYRAAVVHKNPSSSSSSSSLPLPLSKLLSQYSSMSRRAAEEAIRNGSVTVAGQVVRQPHYRLSWQEAASGGGILKVDGRRIELDPKTNATTTTPRIWIVHKLAGELVSESDPDGRPCLLARLRRDETTKLMAIGRLDMMTQGLLLLTNNGDHARQMELPRNALHRTYRVRVHGAITPTKLNAMRHGMQIHNVRYKGMQVQLHDTTKTTGRMPKTRQQRHRHHHRHRRANQAGGTNTWLSITTVEGKNRQIRIVLNHLQLQVTRLIRVAFGDYQLGSIPPGGVVEVPWKPLETQRNRGPLPLAGRRTTPKPRNSSKKDKEPPIQPVQWIRHA